jgi:HAD superfamily 5'-nucleotidase-like hydrolase
MTDALHADLPPPHRGLFCNRTLNLRAIRAIGYDMDYTLIHYNVDAWEQRAYSYLKQKLQEFGWPVDRLEYLPAFTVRGLILDVALGNIVKADRFGYVKRAYHGTRRLSFDEQREVYTRAVIDLADARWVFLNTFFSLSEACMYAQLVDRFDERRFTGVLGYADLYTRIRKALDDAHAEGRLKAEIIQMPAAYVEPDPDAPLALLDQKESGKRLLLITNSEWHYTREMMAYCFDRFLPQGSTWRDLFEVVLVSSRKPHFFSVHSPFFEVVSEDGLLRPLAGPFRRGGVYVGGDAKQIEEYLGLSGAEILYVGDHLYTDVRVTKDVRRWRTALIMRELEGEFMALAAVRASQARLDQLMSDKEALEYQHAQLRLRLQRLLRGYGPGADGRPPAGAEQEAAVVEAGLSDLRNRLDRLDGEIAPLANTLGELFNATWGPLMRMGNDKSHLARQMERYADLYTSRVSNFLFQTPFAYLRSPRGSLPHDPLARPAPASEADEPAARIL